MSIIIQGIILLVLILGLFGAAYLYLGIEGIRAGDNQRILLNTINSTISYINQLRADYSDKGEMIDCPLINAELSSRYEAVHAVLKSQKRQLGHLPVPQQPELPYTPEDLQTAIRELGDTARTGASTYQEIRNQVYYYSIALTVTGFLLIIAFTVLALYFKRFITDFFQFIVSGGDHLHGIIMHDDSTRTPRIPKWQEEAQYQGIIDSLKRVIFHERELSENIPEITLENFIPALKELITPIVSFERIALAFMDRSGEIIAESAISSQPRILLEAGFVEHIDKTTLAGLTKNNRGRIIGDLERHYEEINQSRATQLLLEEGMKSSLTVPLVFNETCIGFLFLSSTSMGRFSPEHLSAVYHLVQTYKQSLYYQYLLQQLLAETSEAFVRLMEKKDNETSLHILRMTRYSHMIAREYLIQNPGEQPARFVREIMWFAPLHDIGKVGIPDSILLKPGALTEEEFKIMRSHVTMGTEVIKGISQGISRVLDMNLMKTAIELVETHHEKYDGSGYPQGLRGEDIPLSGRIIAVADVFDALTSRRPYKEAWPVDQALNVLRKESGSHFCPKVMKAMERVLPELLKVYERYKEV